jgi:hypothetical protein
MWNIRQDLSWQWQPTPTRQTEFVSAHAASQPAPEPISVEPSFGPPRWARAARVGSLGGQDFVCQPDARFDALKGQCSIREVRCPKHDGTLRVLYAARLADCRSCPLRKQCQGHGIFHQKVPPREHCPASSISAGIQRVSASVFACSSSDPLARLATPGIDTVASEPLGHCRYPIRFTSTSNALLAHTSATSTLADVVLHRRVTGRLMFSVHQIAIISHLQQFR